MKTRNEFMKEKTEREKKKHPNKFCNNVYWCAKRKQTTVGTDGKTGWH